MTMVSSQIAELRRQCKDRDITFHHRHGVTSLTRLLDASTAEPRMTATEVVARNSNALPDDIHRALIYLRRMSTRHEQTLRTYIESLHAG